MVFKEKEIKNIFLLHLAAIIVISMTLVDATNFDCKGKGFYCLNSTHFMICVDLGYGVSTTVDDFVIPCPPPSLCIETNEFECEYHYITTTVKPMLPSEPNSNVEITTSSFIEDIDYTTFYPPWYVNEIQKSEKYLVNVPTTERNINTRTLVIETTTRLISATPMDKEIIDSQTKNGESPQTVNDFTEVITPYEIASTVVYNDLTTNIVGPLNLSEYNFGQVSGNQEHDINTSTSRYDDEITLPPKLNSINVTAETNPAYMYNSYETNRTFINGNLLTETLEQYESTTYVHDFDTTATTSLSVNEPESFNKQKYLTNAIPQINNTILAMPKYDEEKKLSTDEHSTDSTGSSFIGFGNKSSTNKSINLLNREGVTISNQNQVESTVKAAMHETENLMDLQFRATTNQNLDSVANTNYYATTHQEFKNTTEIIAPSDIEARLVFETTTSQLPKQNYTTPSEQNNYDLIGTMTVTKNESEFLSDKNNIVTENNHELLPDDSDKVKTSPNHQYLDATTTTEIGLEPVSKGEYEVNEEYVTFPSQIHSDIDKLLPLLETDYIMRPQAHKTTTEIESKTPLEQNNYDLIGTMTVTKNESDFLPDKNNFVTENNHELLPDDSDKGKTSPHHQTLNVATTTEIRLEPVSKGEYEVNQEYVTFPSQIHSDIDKLSPLLETDYIMRPQAQKTTTEKESNSDINRIYKTTNHQEYYNKFSTDALTENDFSSDSLFTDMSSTLSYPEDQTKQYNYYNSIETTTSTQNNYDFLTDKTDFVPENNNSTYNNSDSYATTIVRLEQVLNKQKSVDELLKPKYTKTFDSTNLKSNLKTVLPVQNLTNLHTETFSYQPKSYTDMNASDERTIKKNIANETEIKFLMIEMLSKLPEHNTIKQDNNDDLIVSTTENGSVFPSVKTGFVTESDQHVDEVQERLNTVETSIYDRNSLTATKSYESTTITSQTEFSQNFNYSLGESADHNNFNSFATTKAPENSDHIVQETLNRLPLQEDEILFQTKKFYTIQTTSKPQNVLSDKINFVTGNNNQVNTSSSILSHQGEIYPYDQNLNMDTTTVLEFAPVSKSRESLNLEKHIPSSNPQNYYTPGTTTITESISDSKIDQYFEKLPNQEYQSVPDQTTLKRTETETASSLKSVPGYGTSKNLAGSMVNKGTEVVTLQKQFYTPVPSQNIYYIPQFLNKLSKQEYLSTTSTQQNNTTTTPTNTSSYNAFHAVTDKSQFNPESETGTDQHKKSFSITKKIVPEMHTTTFQQYIGPTTKTPGLFTSEVNISLDKSLDQPYLDENENVTVKIRDHEVMDTLHRMPSEDRPDNQKKINVNISKSRPRNETSPDNYIIATESSNPQNGFSRSDYENILAATSTSTTEPINKLNTEMKFEEHNNEEKQVNVLLKPLFKLIAPTTDHLVDTISETLILTNNDTIQDSSTLNTTYSNNLITPEYYTEQTQQDLSKIVIKSPDKYFDIGEASQHIGETLTTGTATPTHETKSSGKALTKTKNGLDTQHKTKLYVIFNGTFSTIPIKPLINKNFEVTNKTKKFEKNTSQNVSNFDTFKKIQWYSTPSSNRTLKTSSKLHYTQEPTKNYNNDTRSIRSTLPPLLINSSIFKDNQVLNSTINRSFKAPTTAMVYESNITNPLITKMITQTEKVKLFTASTQANTTTSNKYYTLQTAKINGANINKTSKPSTHNVTNFMNISNSRASIRNNVTITRHNSTFSCLNRLRGKYSDANSCGKFYICIGRVNPIVGNCPGNTIFSDILKQCTRNLSHCIRNNRFKCVSSGRYSDVWKPDTYYICVKSKNKYVRFTLKCQNGYHLDKQSITCVEFSVSTPITPVSQKVDSNSKLSVSSSDSISTSRRQSGRNDFSCTKEGKYADPYDCRKYYVCSKNSKSEFRRRNRKCDSDEVFHRKKKKCVDADSYECN
ncbi:uncharacterized protein LOC126970441 isoform X2 [Leptidea sinapis]|uniref:uncharacterized protein LOC126970441 isoform X2 n=1 Tax=Leptidea sinapis TaxID=189913 RepID=UPI0021260A95|nr:uncharacterized protein LOC126970441 isoform X2 [Leptidea sinapis]